MTESDGIDMFKNVMVALGLGPDEEYDDRYFDDDEFIEMDDRDADVIPERPVRDRAAAVSRPAGGIESASPSVRTTGTVGAVRPIRPAAADEESGFTVRPITRSDDDAGVVSPMVASKPKMLAPQSFGDAKVLADEFRRGTPVIMQLGDVDRDLARRLIDFASGVCYSLGGAMEKMAPNVFMLVPKGADVSPEERRRIEERGYDRV